MKKNQNIEKKIVIESTLVRNVDQIGWFFPS
jgi:hypothetical protein